MVSGSCEFLMNKIRACRGTNRLIATFSPYSFQTNACQLVLESKNFDSAKGLNLRSGDPSEFCLVGAERQSLFGLASIGEVAIAL